MTDEQKVVYINSQIMCVNIRLAGMAADNLQKIAKKEYPVYGKNDFDALLEEFQIQSNDVIGFFHDR